MGAIIFIAGVLLAACSAIAFYRWGWITTALFAPMAFIPLFVPGCENLLIICIIPLIFGTAGGLCYRNNLGLDFFLTVSSIVFAGLFTADYYILKEVKKYDIIQKGSESLAVMMKQSASEMDRIFDSKKTPKENREKLMSDIQTSIQMLGDRKWIQFARDMMPFSIFMYAASIAGFAFTVMKKIFMKKYSADIKGLEFFRLNDYLIFALIAAWGAFILIDKTHFSTLNVAALNLALAASVLYIIQALGIIKHFMIGRKLPLVMLPVTLFVIFIAGPSAVIFSMILLMGAGTLEVWADFRKLGTLNKQQK